MFAVFTLGLTAQFLAMAGTYALDGNKLVVPSAVTFRTGTAELTPDSAAAIAHVAQYLGDKKYVTTLRIEVHSDNAGSAAEAQTLTERRALAVAKALVAKGVDCKRVLPTGHGPHKPVASNDTPEGKAQNRRVEFHNAALAGRPIGGMAVEGTGKVAGDPCK